MPVVVALWSVAALFVAALLAIAIHRARIATRLIYLVCLAASLATLVAAGMHLLGGTPGEPRVHLPLGLPWIGAHFRIDALSAFFLIVISLGGAGASLFAIGYGQHEEAPGRVLPFYPVFLGAMNLVVLADDAFTFLLAWEFMSLTSWALVMAHHHDADNRRAGYIYIVMASFGTLALLLAFGLLAGPDGGYAFDDIRRADPRMPGLVLMLVLIGAGSKAGLVPLHVWLPLAHPAAPSHVSALMSGVMTKVAVYGFTRVVIRSAGPPELVVEHPYPARRHHLRVLGVLERADAARPQAPPRLHTIENIGIIFIGLGLALAFKANGMAGAAALALSAALLHVFNHCLFKSLLFFGAGAVLSATGERDIEKLGGLIRTMPQTAFLFLAGCIAISALPPLNGFVSEWLTFQAILLSPLLPHGASRCSCRRWAGCWPCRHSAGGRLLRQGIRRHLSRPAAHATGRASPRDGSRLARRHAGVRPALPAGGHSPRARNRCIGARVTQPGRSPHARADGATLAVDRADCGEPQLLQRSPGLCLHCHFHHRHGRGDPQVRLARRPPGTTLGLRLPRSQPRHPIHCR